MSSRAHRRRSGTAAGHGRLRPGGCRTEVLRSRLWSARSSRAANAWPLGEGLAAAGVPSAWSLVTRRRQDRRQSAGPRQTARHPGLGRRGHDLVTARPRHECTGAPWPVSSSLVGSALIRPADASASARSSASRGSGGRTCPCLLLRSASPENTTPSSRYRTRLPAGMPRRVHHVEATDRVAISQEQVGHDRPKPEQPVKHHHRETALLRLLLSREDRSIQFVDRHLSTGKLLELGDTANVVDVAVRVDDEAQVTRLIAEVLL